MRGWQNAALPHAPAPPRVFGKPLMKFSSFLKVLVAAGVAVCTQVHGQKKSYTIGLVAKSQSNPVFQAARVGAMDAAKELGQKHGLTIKVDWRTPNDEDAQKQSRTACKWPPLIPMPPPASVS
jgi:hypothetical protein